MSPLSVAEVRPQSAGSIADLGSILSRQRAAFLAVEQPTLAERRQDLVQPMNSTYCLHRPAKV